MQTYKSSKTWLKTFPTKASHVIQGPGENAGVIDIGNDQAVVFKIESHNHPSQILPIEGAATGVGGCVRDVYCMGADVIGVLNSLHFGDPNIKNDSGTSSGRISISGRVSTSSTRVPVLECGFTF